MRFHLLPVLLLLASAATQVCFLQMSLVAYFRVLIKSHFLIFSFNLIHELSECQKKLFSQLGKQTEYIRPSWSSLGWPDPDRFTIHLISNNVASGSCGLGVVELEMAITLTVLLRVSAPEIGELSYIHTNTWQADETKICSSALKIKLVN